MAEPQRRPPIPALTRAPTAAGWLLHGALAPLAVLLAIEIGGGIGGLAAADAAALLLAYAAVLLSFLAGLAVGPALRPGLATVRLVPPLVLAGAGWVTLLVPVAPALLAMALLHAAAGALDVWTADGIRLPAWYGWKRAVMTGIAVVVLIAAFVALPA